MRLVCPNCGAQYEVSAEAIPPQGRDVQCSSCDHTWFEAPGQSGADAPMAVAPEKPAEVAEPAETPVAEEPQPAPTVPVESEPVVKEPEGAVEAPQAAEPAHNEVAPPSKPSKEPTPAELAAEVRRAREQAVEKDAAADGLNNRPDGAPLLTPEIQGILREEAQLEQSVRDMVHGAGAAAQRPRQKPLDGKATEDFFPDIEGLNSSLRAEDAALAAAATGGAAAAVATGSGRSGFWKAFAIVCLIALLAMLMYIFAPEIASVAPEFESALKSYVAMIDNIRVNIASGIGGNA